MPRFYFDSYNGAILVRDMDGIVMPNRANARLEALAALGEITKDETPGGDVRTMYVNVRDETGAPIYTACISLVGRWLD